MGGAMSLRLAEAGLDLSVFDLDAARAAPACASGARLAASVAEASGTADMLITMLPTPAAVEEVMLGAGGALEALPERALWIDMSTSAASIAERGEPAAAHGAYGCSMPPWPAWASGAAAGTLQIFVGGEAADLELARPILAHMDDPQRIFHVGAHGAGYAVKLMLNLLWFDQLVAIAEVLTIGVRAGVDLSVLRRA